jgi:hypothetical protein
MDIDALALTPIPQFSGCHKGGGLSQMGTDLHGVYL